MTRLLYIPLAVIAAVALLAGCGGSGDEPLSKAELTKQADAICWKAHNESFTGVTAYVVREKKQANKELPVVLGKAITVATLPAMQGGLEKLEDLSVSSEDEEEMEQFTVALSEAIKVSEEDPASSKSTSGAVYNNANRLAAKFHLGRCKGLP